MTKLQCDVFYDFSWPFVYNAAVWLDEVKELIGDELKLNWRNFSLEQINYKGDDNWKVWEVDDLTKTKSLMASIAGEAAKRQGKEAFDKFFLNLLKKRHEQRVPLNDNDIFIEVATECNLDVDRFKEDILDSDLVNIIAKDHEDASGTHGAFGTPTFLFNNGQSIYLKTFIPPKEESLESFEHFVGLFSERSYFGEVKRPQPPWPKGAL